MKHCHLVHWFLWHLSQFRTEMTSYNIEMCQNDFKTRIREVETNLYVHLLYHPWKKEIHSTISMTSVHPRSARTLAGIEALHFECQPIACWSSNYILNWNLPLHNYHPWKFLLSSKAHNNSSSHFSSQYIKYLIVLLYSSSLALYN